MNFYPFYVVFWLLLAAGLFLWPVFDLNTPLKQGIFNTGISPGWLALLLAVYNVARWWSARSYRIHEQAAREAAERRRRGDGPTPPKPVIDPTFDFTGEPTPDDGPPGSG